MEDSEDLLHKAKEYAFFLLKFRQRSEKELYSRLKKKKFPERVIECTLTFLKEKKFIDDIVFARVWVESRLKKPLGIKRINQELRLKGIDKEIIQNALDDIKEDYSETEVVTKIAKEKLKRLKSSDPLKARNRVYAYLLRRGFSAQTVYDVLNNLCRQTS